MDDPVGSGEEGFEIILGDIRSCPFHLVELNGRKSTGNSND
jgi:hypothetical protein